MVLAQYHKEHLTRRCFGLLFRWRYKAAAKRGVRCAMWSVVIEQILLSATLAVSALALIYKQRLFPRLGSFWLFLICCLLVYALILARVYLIEVRFETELDAFDLDRDGFFSGHELTPSQA